MTAKRAHKNQAGGSQLLVHRTEQGGTKLATSEQPMPVTQPGTPSPMEGFVKQGKAQG